MTAENQMEAKPSRSHEYTPLRDPSLQLRLLEVCNETSELDDLIKCKLTTWDVEVAPPYHAISYTWGPEEPTETILLDQGVAAVRKNCADVLRQLIYFKSCRYYWLDAICIDQANVMEKNAQVAMMGSIFSKAEHVLACIGQDDDDGEYALQAIRNQRRYNDSPPSKRSDINPWAVIIKIRLHGRADTPTDVDLTRFALSLAALSRRPYFERVWVVQEIYLGREASVCCGKVKLPIAHLQRELYAAEFIIRRLRKTSQTVQGDPQSRPIQLESVPMELLNALRPIELALIEKCGWMLRDRSELRESRPLMTFNRLVENFSTLRCHDPRDTVYGALALVDWQGAPPITPDYNKSAFSLALEMLRMHVDGYRVPQLLQNLKLGKEDGDVRFAIALRQQNRAACLEGQTQEPSPLHTQNKRQYRTLGWQLKEHEHRWRLARKMEYTGPVSWSQKEIIVPHETRLGDWLIYAMENWEEKRVEAILKPRHDCIVLRKVGSLYAFIGRAIEVGPRVWSMGHELQSSKARFTLWFDVEDYLVLAATHGQLSLTEVVETGVCSEPFSSYATIWDRKTKSYPSSSEFRA